MKGMKGGKVGGSSMASKKPAGTKGNVVQKSRYPRGSGGSKVPAVKTWPSGAQK